MVMALVLLFMSFLSRFCLSQQAGAAQLPAKKPQSRPAAMGKLPWMPLEELHGTTLTCRAKKATLQHGREAGEHGSSTRCSPKVREEIQALILQRM